jgi:pyridoxine 5-phosphate synthase
MWSFAMVRLGVNIDHVATLRQARRAVEPDPVWAAVQAQLGGADGITIHLREDRRHIQERDLRLLREVVTVRLNLEMAADATIAQLAVEVKPDEVTVVPERREELTTEGGLDALNHRHTLEPLLRRLQGYGIHLSLFIDADVRQVEVSRVLGAQAIEFHTGRYAEARTVQERQRELAALIEAARFAHEQGLHVHMGHGLNYVNVQAVAAIPAVEELNIGHSIVSRSIFVGMERAVREMKTLVSSAVPGR